MITAGHRRATLRRLQVRITAVAMVAIVLVVAFGSVGLVRRFRDELVQQVDQQLVDTARFVEEVEGTGLLDDRGTGDELAQVVSPEGEVVFESSRLEGEGPLVDPSAGTPTGPATVATEREGDLRIVSLDLDGRVLVLGRSLAEVDDAVSSLVRLLAIGVPLLAAGLGLLVWLTVGRSLRPVAEALGRERQLVADASHELRTPLAGVRVLLESESEQPSEQRRNRDDALATLARLEAIVADLLLLARDEAPPQQRLSLIDLDELVLRQAHIARRSGHVGVDTSGVSAGQVTGDEQELERAVENLLSNAVRHATSAVEVRLHEVDGEVELTVSDDGAGVPESERERVFERFTRLDDARGRDGGGAGLGLPIAREVVHRHGGTVVLEEGTEGGARFSVRLPASVGAANPAPAASAAPS